MGGCAVTQDPRNTWTAEGLCTAASEWRRYPNGATAAAICWGWSLGEGAQAVLRACLEPEEVAALEGAAEQAWPACLLALHRCGG